VEETKKGGGTTDARGSEFTLGLFHIGYERVIPFAMRPKETFRQRSFSRKKVDKKKSESRRANDVGRKGRYIESCSRDSGSLQNFHNSIIKRTIIGPAKRMIQGKKQISSGFMFGRRGGSNVCVCGTFGIRNAFRAPLEKGRFHKEEKLGVPVESLIDTKNGKVGLGEYSKENPKGNGGGGTGKNWEQYNGTD